MVLTAGERHISQLLKDAYFPVSSLKTSLKATSITDSRLQVEYQIQQIPYSTHRLPSPNVLFY